LDVSAIAYLTLFPAIALLFYSIKPFTQISKVLNGYYLILIPVTTIIQAGNIAIFNYWGVLLNNRAISYLTNPVEILASLNGLQTLIMTMALIAGFTGIFIFYKKYLKPAVYQLSQQKKHNLVVITILVLITGIGLRGGLQQIPINESTAYYSKENRLNQIATNSLWHLANNIHQSSLTESNPYRFVDEALANNVVDSLFLRNVLKNRTQLFKSINHPNVVILLLESYTADIIGPLGGVDSVTPFFNSLCSQGLLFSNVYSSGFRTDQALVSVISGFPAQPNKSIIRFPDKTQRLPALSRSFKNAGYKTSFYYGGELGFANMNSYLTAAGFDYITGKDKYPSDAMNSKWGAHDGIVLQQQALELDTTNQPFFSFLLTLSTHEPFEVPVTTPFNGTSESEQFKKAAWYTDASLREYFNKVSKSSWFSNTIFVLVADHGHRLPLLRSYQNPLIRHIPLLIYSPLLQDSLAGKQMAQTATQNDLAATLLGQLGMDTKDYNWSNDLMVTPRNHFAYLSLDESIEWVTPDDTLLLDISHFSKEKKPESGKPETRARAYLQLLYQQFLGL
ncbi:MAG TPA: LTA synthase family protein, partial [Bacteroidia bacterium]|nr:LTA synthase family protein [Bacteroidia bacterium]